MVTDEQYLAQLAIAWPEFSIVFSEPDRAFIATLRQDPGEVMTARHLAPLEGLLVLWDRRRQQAQARTGGT